MYRKEWIMRQIEILVDMIALMLGHKISRDYDGALEVASAACRRILGMDLNVLSTLSEESLLRLFTSGTVIDTGRCFLAGSLLNEQAQVYELEGSVDAAHSSFRKALALLLEAAVQDSRWRTDEYQGQIEGILTRLHGQPLPTALQRRLLLYREAIEQYGKAEDMLFTLRESGASGWQAEAASFYQRLLAKPDDQLDSGGLPRDEVEEGLEEILRAGNS